MSSFVTELQIQEILLPEFRSPMQLVMVNPRPLLFLVNCTLNSQSSFRSLSWKRAQMENLMLMFGVLKSTVFILCLCTAYLILNAYTCTCTHLAIQAILAEDRRGKVVVLGNIPGNEQFHLATSISQHLGQVVICERVKGNEYVTKKINK